MILTLLPNTFTLSDTGFYFETFRPTTLKQINSIIDFYPEKGYISFDTNIGELIVNWEPGNYEKSRLSRDLTILHFDLEVSHMNMSIDDIYYSWEYRDDRYHITVYDARTPAYKAQLIMDDEGFLDVVESSFSDPTRKYQMLYYAERNKALFKECD